MTISTNDQWELKKQRLADVPAEDLAEALLDLAVRSEVAHATVERLIATPDEAASRFKSQLAGIRRRRRFVDWRGASEFAYELSVLLDGLRDGVQDPRTGVELAASFFKADGVIMEHCDDSSGSIGDVFRHDAVNVFAHFAAQCSDKRWVVEILIDLMADDNYGVRDALIDSADRYLSAEDLALLVDYMWERESQDSDEYRSRHWLIAIESIARQLRDPILFEKARRTSWGELNGGACLDIAQVHFDAGDPQSALKWLEKAPVTDGFKQYERDQLLLKIFEALGDKDRAATQARAIFDRSHSTESLDRLLGIIGRRHRTQVIQEARDSILAAEGFSSGDADFLVECGCTEAAERYILRHSEELNGRFYTSLLPLADAMEKQGRVLPAAAIYRALLDSILERGVSKYYSHGVRYLRKLDRLATKTANWTPLESHDVYTAQLEDVHGRKRSFWKRYAKQEGQGAQ